MSRTSLVQACWHAEAAGDAYPVSLFQGENGTAPLEAERQACMQCLFADVVGFAAANRIFGVAHNFDFEPIGEYIPTVENSASGAASHNSPYGTFLITFAPT
ncbi:hypothetical protein [Bradyrhizobium iriomotense]|uniref:hypothetical protein n=1 Tax=Bradyrhizobium iriomotense TaxID=441950 RepID=UPI003D9B44CB